MRFCAIILTFACIGAGLVLLRRMEMRQRYRTQQLIGRQAELRRTLHAQELEIERLAGPAELDHRAGELSLDLTDARRENAPAEPPARDRGDRP